MKQRVGIARARASPMQPKVLADGRAVRRPRTRLTRAHLQDSVMENPRPSSGNTVLMITP